MKEQEWQLYIMKSEIMKALGQPIRLAVIDYLKDGEKCVCEICKFVEGSYANVSKHLGVLKNAGLLSSRKEGTNIYYSIKMPCSLDFFRCVNDIIKTRISEQSKLTKTL